MKWILFAAGLTALAQDGWKSIGPFGGPAGLISVDRSNPDRLIASSRNGNVFLSTNAGREWKRLPFPYIPGASIEALKIHPKDPNFFLAAVADETGDYAGLYESRDGGSTWKQVKALEGQAVFALAFFLADPAVIGAGTRGGVWVSRDMGRVWKKMHREGQPGPAPVMSLAFDPTDANTVYAGTTHLPWKTVDGGVTWKSIHAGMIDDSDVFSIHVDSKSPARVYASACSGIYASTSRGEQWRKAQGIPGTDRRTHIVTEDPAFSHLIYAGTTAGLWKSADAGQTWRKLNSHLIRSVEFHPTDGRLMYLATQDRGLLKSMTAGLTTAEINQGFVGRPVQRLAFAGDLMAASVLRTDGVPAVFLSMDGGRSWTADEMTGDVTGFQNQLYARARSAIFRREGKTWTPVPIPGNPEVRLLEADAHLWAATANGLYRSADGRRWMQAALPAKGAVAEIVPGRRGAAIRIGDQFWLTTALTAIDAKSWTKIASPPGGKLFSLALHPTDENVVFATTASGLLKSRDRGATWRKIEGGLHPGFMYSITPDTDRPRHWYLSQMGKVFHSKDDGETWELLSGEIESALVRSLKAPGGDKGIFAVTSGQGIFMRPNLPIIRALGGEN
jgi:photosystem II stability/assembly factor-like uncharacterized protein